MSLIRKINTRTQKRKLRVRMSIKHSGMPRVSIFRSLNHIYAQLIDDSKHMTLASSSTLEIKSSKGDKTSQAHAIGIDLAQKAQKLGVEHVVFDRGPFLYHGRVKALAQGLREGGLKV